MTCGVQISLQKSFVIFKHQNNENISGKRFLINLSPSIDTVAVGNANTNTHICIYTCVMYMHVKNGEKLIDKDRFNPVFLYFNNEMHALGHT